MRYLKWLATALIVGLIFIWAISLFAPKTNNVQYGTSFSAPYAQSLGLDWKKVYLAMLDELKPKYLRLSAYWDVTEPEKDQYNFDDLDFQVKLATEKNAKIVLAVGRRLPRWPECHDPGFIQNLSKEELKNAQLSYIETVISRYKNYPSIASWQIENEPFLGTFGICPQLDTSLLDSEIALVKDLDPTTPVTITDSGELSWWVHSGSRGEIFGTTFYRYVFSDVFKRYWTNYIPAIYYRFKGGLLRLMHPGKKIVIMELEAEPWTTAGIPNTPIPEQFKTMSFEHFNTIIGIAHNTGFSPQYLWGVEWWYWIKSNGHPEFWDKAKELMSY